MSARTWWADLIRAQAAGLSEASLEHALVLGGIAAGRPVVLDSEEAGDSHPSSSSLGGIAPGTTGVRPPERRCYLSQTGFESLKPLPAEVRPPKPDVPFLTPTLAKTWVSAPRKPELSPWARLLRVFEAVLRRPMETRRLDFARLVQRVAEGRTLTDVPFQARLRWAPKALLIAQRAHSLIPYWEDQLRVLERLRRHRGSEGLAVQHWQIPPEADHLSWVFEHIPPEAPVVVLGDLGLYDSAAAVRAWRDFGLALTDRGHALAALVPAPLARCHQELRELWNVIPWEPEVPPSKTLSQAELEARAVRLLRLLAFEVRVEPGLLRSVRRLLPPSEADVGTEADAWNHRGTMGHSASAGTLDPAFARTQRPRLKDEDEDRIKDTIKTSRIWHQDLPAWIGREEALNLAAFGHLDPNDPRVLEARAALIAMANSLSTEGNRDPAQERFLDYFRRFNLRTSDEVWPDPKDSEYWQALHRAWHLAHEGMESAKTPPGHRPDQRPPPPGEVRAAESITIALHARDLVFWRNSRVRGPGFPLGTVVSNSDYVSVAPERGRGDRLIVPEARPVSLPIETNGALTVVTELQRLTFSPAPAPRWASATGYDHFGFWTELVVKGVVQRLRWIPPGTYVQGSPAAEAGRYTTEAQRRVTFTSGFWLGDTPVTQRLYEAVTEANPSRFRLTKEAELAGGELPVEQVSFDDAQRFFKKLKELVPEFRGELPSEAAWEYACRAGTGTATYAGDLEILGMRNAPLLDSIAWYMGNCGMELELTAKSARSIEGWSERDHAECKVGGTHAVKRKLANSWGLYDMLGNVWEWCQDRWDGGSGSEAEEVVGPAVNERGSKRVLRGGSWRSSARSVRAADRDAFDPGNHDDFVGFRFSEVHGRPLGGRSEGGGAAAPESSGRPAERSEARGPDRGRRRP